MTEAKKKFFFPFLALVPAGTSREWESLAFSWHQVKSYLDLLPIAAEWAFAASGLLDLLFSRNFIALEAIPLSVDLHQAHQTEPGDHLFFIR